MNHPKMPCEEISNNSGEYYSSSSLSSSSIRDFSGNSRPGYPSAILGNALTILSGESCSSSSREYPVNCIIISATDCFREIPLQCVGESSSNPFWGILRYPYFRTLRQFLPRNSTTVSFWNPPAVFFHQQLLSVKAPADYRLDSVVDGCYVLDQQPLQHPQ